MVLKFIIVAIAVIAFLGGGGLNVISSFTKKDEELGETDIRNGSEQKAITEDVEIPTTPKEKKSQDQSNLILKLTERKEAKKRQEEDIKKLDTRKEKAITRPKFFLKKSGAELVLEKRRQEDISFKKLKQAGSTFGGKGKFGRPKIFGNPNFDLGLPSDATQADRDRVVARRALRSGKRRAQAIKASQITDIQQSFKGKSFDELKEIAKGKGFRVTGKLSSKALAKIFQARGITL